mgnify:FL=1
MDPQQELFSALLTELNKLGYDVYDGFLPPKNTPYPFIYLADSTQIDEENKTAVFGRVSQTIHVWHNSPKQRGTVSKMLLDAKTMCRKLEKTDNFSWFVRDVNQRILSDDTTKQPLLHGILSVEFSFS